ncbi:MAG: hypothetical protein GX161_07060 [Firmicutes bacterium]|nr:hypothetical protein [Bacillota bacterium]
MEYVVRGVFSRPEAAQAALDEMIRLGFDPRSVAFRARWAARSGDGDPLLAVDSDLRGAFLAERIMTSPSATGFNLGGNSTLSGTSLGDLGALLEEVAEAEARPAAVRIYALLRTTSPGKAEILENVLRRNGASRVRTETVAH